MYSLGILCFVLAMGFVTAAFMSELHLNATGNPARFVLSFNSPVSVLYSVSVCLFAGPYIVISAAHSFWRMGYLPLTVFSLCCLLSTAWSFCSGVLIVELLRAGGLIAI